MARRGPFGFRRVETQGRKSFSFEIGRACGYNKRVVRAVRALRVASCHCILNAERKEALCSQHGSPSRRGVRISIARANAEDGCCKSIVLSAVITVKRRHALHTNEAAF